MTTFGGLASSGVGTEGSVTISSLVVGGLGDVFGVTCAAWGRTTRGVEALALGGLPARYSAAALSKMLTDGWAVVLVVEIVRVGKDEVKTTALRGAPGGR